MVALKTVVDEISDRSDDMKQERRGGIENAFRLAQPFLDRGEAGTPWWH